MSTATTQVNLPADLVERLRAKASEHGLELGAYLVYLEQRESRLTDPKAQDAARFMFSKHGASLRKLAE
jgi:hypothetical protein